MTSRIVSFFKIFHRGNVAAASAGPNSWATISLWRRFFELKEKEEQEECETFLDFIMEEYQNNNNQSSLFPPVESELAVKERKEMVSRYYRGLRDGNNRNDTHFYNNNNNNSSSSSSRTVNGNSTSHTMDSYRNNDSHEDDLNIPVGNFHVTLAQ